MSTDDLLKAVAKVVRDDEPEADPRWNALVEGKLSPGDREALEELTRSSRRDREAWQMLEPLGSEVRAKFTDRILSDLEHAKDTGARPASHPPGAKVIPLRPKRRWPLTLVAVGSAAAVALLVLLASMLTSSPESPLEITSAPSVAPRPDPRGPSPPSYEIAAWGGDRSLRSETDASVPAARIVLVDPESWLEITLRPATPVRDPITVRASLVKDGHTQPWDVQVDVSPDGAVRIAGSRMALFPGVSRGPLDIAIAVGAGTLPSSPEDQEGRSQRFRQAIFLGEPTAGGADPGERSRPNDPPTPGSAPNP